MSGARTCAQFVARYAWGACFVALLYIVVASALRAEEPRAKPPAAAEKLSITPAEQEQLSRLMLSAMQAQAQYQQVLSSPQFRALERQVQDAAAALEAEIAKLRQKFGKDAACQITFDKMWRCPPPPPPKK